jgi:hypothetical protein
MANNFKSFQSTDITTETVVYTAPANTQVTIIGMSIANTSGNLTTSSLKLNSAFIVKNAPIPVGASLVGIGAEQKVVMEPGDTISVVSDETVDAILSILEIS